jgi:hypothetical protein
VYATLIYLLLVYATLIYLLLVCATLIYLPLLHPGPGEYKRFHSALALREHTSAYGSVRQHTFLAAAKAPLLQTRFLLHAIMRSVHA